MVLRRWENIPEDMQKPEIKEYYDILKRHQAGLRGKRIFDIIVGSVLLLIVSPVLIIIALLIKIDSPGTIFYRQERVTAYGKKFRIHKFRTMVNNADRIGTSVTLNKDKRVTKVGRILRKYRLDELPQLIDIVLGDMSFVGARPEVEKYVKEYTPEMKATLLLPAGVTSEASIRYKDEAGLLEEAENVDKVYIEEILPEKMKYNLKSLREFSFFNEIKVMVQTVFAVYGTN